MLKYMFCLFLSSWFHVVWAHNSDYYVFNPNETQKALARCPQQSPADISCDQLEQIAIRLSDLATELRINPQAYGRSILSIQEKIAKQIEISKLHSTSELNSELNQNQHSLRERLTIIKWLESPNTSRS